MPIDPIAPNRFEVEVVAPKDLAADEIATWRELAGASGPFANPLFGPDFSRIVARVRPDARVAVFRRRGEAVGFLPYHQRPGRLARPIAAPFSDYQALVSKGDIGLAGDDALRLAGIASFRFNGLVDPHGLFAGESLDEGETHAVVLDTDPDELLEAARAQNPKKFKNYRRLEHRLDREVGPIRLVADDRSPEAFQALIEWKRDQFRRTGLQDVLRPDWAQRLMQTLFETRNLPARGLMVSLYAGDVLVAGHFGVRSDTVYHPWIASANPALSAYSPGQAMLSHAIRAMPELGLSVYDLGPGTDHYKRPFANQMRRTGAGLVTASGVAGALASAGERAWEISGLSRLPAADKVRRRIDHILTLHPTLGGAVAGFAEAAEALKRRPLGNQALSDAVA